MRNLRIKEGSITTESGDAALISSVAQRVKMVRGEWFMNTDAGLPYVGLAGLRNARLAAGYIIEEINKVENVAQSEASDAKIIEDTRQLRVDANVTGSDGESFLTSVVI